MVGTKETVRVRLEIEFEVLAGELSIMEQDTERMTLSKFIEVYSPERRGCRLILHLVDIKEKSEKRKTKRNNS